MIVAAGSEMPPLDEEAIFDAARRIEAAEARRLYLESACSGDAKLLARVEALLRVDEQNPRFLASPVVRFDAAGEDALERPGDKIGPYKLVDQIGEGGFGLVFRAEQQDPIRRLVALKILKPGMDTREVVARFEAERQALALMDHPGIARVFDAGATPLGRPYFVMELVEGAPITSYCDAHGLSPRQRLAIFADVCRAVQHAHQKGIIHRDLKPTNVLVTLYDGRPAPKIIDFGVAKALGERLTERTLVTGLAGIIGTLDYMSPEQAQLNARDIDTRADIYSLGVLLYELLTGSTPLTRERLKQTPITEALRLIREEDAPKPSTRLGDSKRSLAAVSAQHEIEPLKLARVVRGELDWIVLKALDKDRDRRYSTAIGLARDVERYLRDEPVEACSPSAPFRLRKLLRRHRGPAAAACAVLAVLIGGIATTSVAFLSARAAQRRAEESQWRAEKNHRRAEENQRRAEENFEIAKKAVDDYLNHVTEEPDLKRADFNVLRKKLLESAVPFYQRLVERTPGDAAQEAARGRASGRLGDLHGQMGEMAEALADYESTRSIFAKLAADFSTVPQYHFELATSHRKLGDVLFELGRGEEAEAAYRDAVSISAILAADFPAVREYRDGLAITRDNLGRLLAQLGKPDEAEAAFRDALAAYRAALAIYEQLAADFPTAPEHRASLGGIRKSLGLLLARLGKRDDAEAAFRHALVIYEKLVVDFPTVPEYRDLLARTRNNLGLLLTELARHDEAEAAYHDALTVSEKLAADFPTVPEYRQCLGAIRRNLGTLFSGLGKCDKAEAAFRDALAVQQRLAADLPMVPKYRDELANTHYNLGQIQARQRQWKDAAASLSQAIELGPMDNWPAYQLGFLLAEIGDQPTYQQYCDDMLSRWGKATEPGPAASTAKACLLLRGGVADPAQLAGLVEAALSADDKHYLYEWILFTKGLHDFRTCRFAEARAACRDSRQRTTAPALKVIDLTVESMSLYRLGQTDEAREALAAARGLFEQMQSQADEGDLGEWWHDWLCCRILLREAEAP